MADTEPVEIPVTQLTEVDTHGQGMSKKPRVLVVDDAAAVLNFYHSMGSTIFPCDLVCMGYGALNEPSAGVIGTNKAGKPNTIEDIVAYAMDPANGIDAMVTDMYHGKQYGFDLAKALKEAGFKGPIATHSTKDLEYWQPRMKEIGVLGPFHKDDVYKNDPEISAFSAVVDAVAKNTAMVRG